MSESDCEKAARSVALEQAYVHEVYEQCAEKTAQSRHWPRIYKFLEELEPGALVCDIGCGNGKYLSVNNNVFKVGADRCKRLTDIAREKENEVLICDNLALPFRDESFDAVLSIAVVHHFATTERRVNALKELARVLRIGGRLVISVWAMEQRHRKFESQDVLVPWPKAYYLNSESSAVCPSGKLSAGGMPCINELDHDRIAQKCLLTSKRNGGRKCKSRSYWVDPLFSPSPSTSSLSSPNETCYSFFRRALQKLAGGKRGSGNRAWFLENWQNGGCKNRRNYETDDIGDVDDIPIELRRLEDDNVTFSKLPDALSIKSKSLGDILDIQRLDLVRSRSSIPGFSSTVTSELYLDEESKSPSPSPTPPPPPPPPLPPPSGYSGPYATIQPSLMERTRTDDPRLEPLAAPKAPTASFSRSFSSSGKPRLVKQKTNIPDDATLEFSEKPHNTAIREIIKDLTDIEKVESLKEKRRNVRKQSSMNEELMSMERLIERDRVRRNIMKQASLNEEIICKPSRTFGNFRDSLLYSGNATKRFQLIKSGLTNRIKQSTTSMEKVSSLAIKNGFVKILQGWTSSESHDDDSAYSASDEKSGTEIFDNTNRTRDKDLSPKINKNIQLAGGALNENSTACSVGKSENEPIERRLSREDGSDSSKDSSLQSDTSVDSEDSFASVIFVPKQQQQRVDYHNHYQQQQHYNRLHQQNSKHNHQNHHFPSLIDVTTVPVGCYQLRTTSAPPSPRIKHPPDSHGPRLKLISMSPLLKQFPATSKSLPPPSPPGLSPRNLNPFSDPRPFFPPSDLPSFDSLSTIHPLKSPTDIQNDSESMEEIKDRDEATEDIDRDPEPSDVTPLTREEETIKLTERDTEIVTEESFDEPQTKTCSLVSDIPMMDKGQRKTSASIEVVVGNTSTISSLELKEKINPIAILTKTTTGATISNSNSATKENVGEKQSEKSSTEFINDDDSRRTRLNQIKELLRQKPGFATRCAKSSFPMVRRASTATSGRLETIDARTLPRLLSLELYNPETDDLDSDSSGLSSPESVGSVISVISDERFTLKKDIAKPGDTEKPVEAAQAEPTTRIQVGNSAEIKEDEDSRANVENESSSFAVSCTQSIRLLETAANVANSLQDTVGTAVIRLEPHQYRGRGYGHHGRNEAEPISKNLSDACRVSRVYHEFPESRNSRISRGSRTRERLDSMPEESNTRGEECHSDCFDFTEKIGDNIINDIERYCQNTRLLEESETTVAPTSEISESTKTTIGQSPKQSETIPNESSAIRSIPAFTPDTIDILPGVNRLRSNCKYSQLVDDTIAWLRGATGPENDDYREYPDNNENITGNDEESIERHLRKNTDEKPREKSEASLRKSLSEDIMDFVMVSKNGECISMAVAMEIDNEIVEGDSNPLAGSKFDVSLDNASSLILDKLEESASTGSVTTIETTDGETIVSSGSSAENKTERGTCVLRYGDSVESTEIEGSIENSVSHSSDVSQTESLGTPRFLNRGGGGSATSLVSSNHEYKTLRERRKYLYQKRSASEEMPARNSASDGTRDDENNPATNTARPRGVDTVGSSMGMRRGAERFAGSLKTPNISGSSSQESLLSDRGGSGGGGAITYHQYYHVFREGELDQLINKYVENLHIISSYYDHASWCIVAEKVQVWTI